MFLPSIKRSLLGAVFLGASTLSLLADPAKSLVPVFGNEGAEFTVKGQSDHVTKGWLPKDWKDNTEWAAVNATYTKLDDSPDKSVAAVRIKVTVKDEGQLQFTTYGGNQKYKQGTKYAITGWVRSPDRTSLKVGIRQQSEPYEWYQEQELSTDTEWKKFEFAFTPGMDFTAFLMFVVADPGTVDVAGLAIEEKP